jgi:iron(III) transport system ATP-binding protein
MAEHRIQQWGTPLDTYHEPVNRLVADFLGEGVWISARILEGQRIASELGSFTLPLAAQDKVGSAIELLIRADDILHDDDSPIRAHVVAKTFRGANFLYTLALPSGQTVYSLVPSHHDHPLGSDIGIRLELNHLVRFEV